MLIHSKKVKIITIVSVIVWTGAVFLAGYFLAMQKKTHQLKASFGGVQTDVVYQKPEGFLNTIGIVVEKKEDTIKISYQEKSNNIFGGSVPGRKETVVKLDENTKIEMVKPLPNGDDEITSAQLGDISVGNIVQVFSNEDISTSGGQFTATKINLINYSNFPN